MNKKLKSIIITFCVGALAIAAYLIADKIIDNNNKVNPTKQAVIMNYNAADVASVKLELPDGDSYFVTEDASVAPTTLSVTYKTTFFGIYEGIEYDSAKSRSLMSVATSLVADRDLGEIDVEDYDIFGLNEPLSKVTVTLLTGETKTLYLGASTNSGSYYLRKDGDDHVYVISGAKGAVFLRSSNDMRIESVVLLNGLETLNTLEFYANGSEKIRISKQLESSVFNPFCKFYIELPWDVRMPANPDNLTSLMESLTAITIWNYITPLSDGTEAELAEYGLAEPWGYLRITTTDGREQELSFSDYYDPDFRYYSYLYDHSNGQIYRINRGKADFLLKYSAAELTTPYMLNAYIQNINYVDIEYGENKVKFEVIKTILSDAEKKELENNGQSAKDYKLRYKLDGIEYSDEAMSNLYMNLAGLVIQNINTGFAHSEEPVLVMTFTPFDVDEAPRTVKLYRVNTNEDFCAVELNGTFNFLVSTKAVNNIINSIAIVKAGGTPTYTL